MVVPREMPATGPATGGMDKEVQDTFAQVQDAATRIERILARVKTLELVIIQTNVCQGEQMTPDDLQLIQLQRTQIAKLKHEAHMLTNVAALEPVYNAIGAPSSFTDTSTDAGIADTITTGFKTLKRELVRIVHKRAALAVAPAATAATGAAPAPAATAETGNHEPPEDLKDTIKELKTTIRDFLDMARKALAPFVHMEKQLEKLGGAQKTRKDAEIETMQPTSSSASEGSDDGNMRKHLIGAKRANDEGQGLGEPSGKIQKIILTKQEFEKFMIESAELNEYITRTKVVAADGTATFQFKVSKNYKQVFDSKWGVRDPRYWSSKLNASFERGEKLWFEEECSFTLRAGAVEPSSSDEPKASN